MSQIKKAERSRVHAKQRRTEEAKEISEIADQLPLASNITKRLDKGSILRLALTYLRLKHLIGQDTESAAEIGSVLKEGELMLDSFNGFFIIISATKEIVYVSDNIEQHMGLSPVDMLGRDIYEFVLQKDHRELKKQFTDRCKGATVRGMGLSPSGNTIDMDLSFSEPSESGPVFENHRQFFLRMKCSYNKRSGVSKFGSSSSAPQSDFLLLQWTGYVHYTMDGRISFLAAVARPLQPTPIMELKMDGNMFISRHSLDLYFMYCDPRLSTMLGYEPDEISGSSMYQYHHPGDLEMCGNCHNNLMTAGTSISKYYRFLSKNNEWCWLQTRATIVYNTTKQPQYIVCMNYIISEKEGRRYLMEYFDKAGSSSSATGSSLPTSTSWSTHSTTSSGATSTDSKRDWPHSHSSTQSQPHSNAPSHSSSHVTTCLASDLTELSIAPESLYAQTDNFGSQAAAQQPITDVYQQSPSELFSPMPDQQHQHQYSSNLPQTPQYNPSPSHTQQYSPGASHTQQYSPGTSHTQQYSPGTSHPQQYSPGTSHPQQYSPGTSHTQQYSPGTSHPQQYSPGTSHTQQYSTSSSHPQQYSTSSSHPQQYSTSPSHPQQFNASPSHHQPGQHQTREKSGIQHHLSPQSTTERFQPTPEGSLDGSPAIVPQDHSPAYVNEPSPTFYLPHQVKQDKDSPPTSSAPGGNLWLSVHSMIDPSLQTRPERMSTSLANEMEQISFEHCHQLMNNTSQAALDTFANSESDSVSPEERILNDWSTVSRVADKQAVAMFNRFRDGLQSGMSHGSMEDQPFQQPFTEVLPMPNVDRKASSMPSCEVAAERETLPSHTSSGFLMTSQTDPFINHQMRNQPSAGLDFQQHQGSVQDEQQMLLDPFDTTVEEILSAVSTVAPTTTSELMLPPVASISMPRSTNRQSSMSLTSNPSVDELTRGSSQSLMSLDSNVSLSSLHPVSSIVADMEFCQMPPEYPSQPFNDR